MTDKNSIIGVYSYQLNDMVKSHFAFNKTRPFYKFKIISSLILIVVNLFNFVSFIPLFGITLLARATTPNPAFDSLAKFGLIITLVFFLLLVISIVGIYQPFIRYRIRKAYKYNRPFYDEEHEIVVDDNGISINLSDWKSSLGWTRIDQVFEYDDGFLLTFNQNDYLTLPKRIFHNRETILKFKKLVANKKETKIVQIK